MRMRTRAAAILATLALVPVAGRAQSFEAAGTRPQGMGGAFVAVADDASAVFWNPAGLAGGAFFSLVLDGHRAEVLPDEVESGAQRSSWLLALTTPALGLSYYRLSHDAVAPAGPDPNAGIRREGLVTHHVGATIVQSLTDSVAVGATLKLVRGIAGQAVVPAADRDAALRDVDLLGRSSTRFDLDAGIMSRGALGSIGLVVRNVTEPAFPTAAGELRVERQVRAGASLALLRGWILASDLDLTRAAGPLGAVREFALGTERQVTRTLPTRAGIRLNTAGDAGRTPSFSAGASYAAYGAVLVDVHVTTGPDEAFRGWGLAARMAF